jgi:effector-binding domain-containing protein
MMPTRIDPPRITRTQDEIYAFIHLLIPRAEMHAVLPSTLKELHTAVTAQGMPIKPWFAHHLTLSDGDFDFEACLPVDESFIATERVQRGLWPSTTVARTFYQGEYPGLPAAWEEFHTWITQNGYSHAGHIYERYIGNRGNTPNPADYRTELSWPLTSSTESEHA